MILQAHLESSMLYSIGSHGCVACADRVEPVYQFEHCVGCVAETVRTFVLLTRLEYPWKILACDAYVRITLSVLKQDVVVRLVLLYQVVLKQECILFATNHHILDVRYMCYQLSGLE